MGIWNKIKAFFDLNKDGKISSEDARVVEDNIKAANQRINDQITDSVTEVRARVKRVKEEIQDVREAVKEAGNQVGDIVEAAKGNKRSGRKPKSK